MDTPAESPNAGPVHCRLPWQDAVWQRLQQARVDGRLPHALLLAGMAGIGKARLARHLAHALVCTSPTEQGDPCGRCRSCQLGAAGTHPDLHWYRPEEPGKAIKVDQVRALSESSVLTAGGSGRSVFTIDPADAMNTAAANALLKTLEEPAGGAMLILVSASPHRLPATIRSRCQQVAMSPPEQALALDWLQTQAVDRQIAERLLDLYGGAPLAVLAAAGSDRLSELDGMWNQFARLADGRGDPVSLAADWQSLDLGEVLDWLVLWCFDLLRLQSVPGSVPRFDRDDSERFNKLAERLDSKDLHAFVDTLYELRRRLSSNLNGQLVLERLLIDWSRLTGRARN